MTVDGKGDDRVVTAALEIGNVPGNQGTITEDQSAQQLKWGGNN